MNKLTVGVIGAGRIGKLHTDNLLRMPNVTIKAIADPYIDKSWADSRSLNAITNVDGIFSDSEIDAVFILSPSTLHAEQIIKAARAGKHIFCEKPIALAPAKIEEAIKAADDAKVKLQIGFNRRFDPDFRRLKEAVESGKIGELYMIKIISRDPGPPPIEYIKESGGIFLDMTIHDFDMVRYLSGSEVEQVYASGAVLIDPQIGEAGDIDTAITTLKLANGALASIDNSRQAVYGYDQRVEVFGSKGSVVAYNNTETRTVFTSTDGVVSDQPVYFFLERYTKSFMQEIEEFIQAVTEDKTPLVTGQDGLAATLVGLAAKKSFDLNKPVEVAQLKNGSCWICYV
jgi:myo-inositol 2-dehydrogenase / D-chiro-inositol 1-dehydrogenase